MATPNNFTILTFFTFYEMITSVPPNDTIMNYVKEAMVKEMEHEFDLACKEFFNNFQTKKEQIIAKWAVILTEHMNVETMGTSLVITIEKPKLDQK